MLEVDGLVSMLPNTTLQNYDLHAAQMVNGPASPAVAYQVPVL